MLPVHLIEQNLNFWITVVKPVLMLSSDKAECAFSSIQNTILKTLSCFLHICCVIAAEVTNCCIHMCFKLMLGSFRLQAGDTELLGRSLTFLPMHGLDAQLQFGSDESVV